MRGEVLLECASTELSEPCGVRSHSRLSPNSSNSRFVALSTEYWYFGSLSMQDLDICGGTTRKRDRNPFAFLRADDDLNKTVPAIHFYFC